MPEVEFLLSPDEQLHQLEFLLDSGLVFVPQLRYKTREYLRLTDAREIYRLSVSLEPVGSWFLVSSAFARYELEMSTLEWRGEYRHFLCSRHGGPYLDFMPSRLRQGSGALLIAGSASFYQTFFIGSLENEVPAPRELRNLHKSVLAWLRDHGRQVVTCKARRRYWIGPEAEAMLRSGVQTNVDGLVL